MPIQCSGVFTSKLFKCECDFADPKNQSSYFNTIRESYSDHELEYLIKLSVSFPSEYYINTFSIATITSIVADLVANCMVLTAWHNNVCPFKCTINTCIIPPTEYLIGSI